MSSTSSLWLPDGWLDIEVKPEGGNFRVTLSAESVPKNIQLFHRTADFLSARGGSGDAAGGDAGCPEAAEAFPPAVGLGLVPG